MVSFGVHMKHQIRFAKLVSLLHTNALDFKGGKYMYHFALPNTYTYIQQCNISKNEAIACLSRIMLTWTRVSEQDASLMMVDSL